MCLNYLKNFKINNNIGYKIFELKNNKLYSLFQCQQNSYPEMVEVNECAYRYQYIYRQTSPKECLASEQRESYDYGFHIFLKLKDAKSYLKKYYDTPNYVICKVNFSDVVATGYQAAGNFVVDVFATIVAKKMTILTRIFVGG